LFVCQPHQSNRRNLNMQPVLLI